MLRAGLSTAGWISVDDTGARHKHQNGVCTQLGNDHFAAFATTASKSRLIFLEVLRAGFTDYVVDAEALAYMRQRALAGAVIDRLAADAERHFPDEAAWRRHLERLGIIGLTVTPDPVRIATEGAVWGSIKAHGLLPDTVILSDDAGQFALDRHALCWVHAERLVHKLDERLRPRAYSKSGRVPCSSMRRCARSGRRYSRSRTASSQARSSGLPERRQSSSKCSSAVRPSVPTRASPRGSAGRGARAPLRRAG